MWGNDSCYYSKYKIYSANNCSIVSDDIPASGNNYVCIYGNCDNTNGFCGYSGGAGWHCWSGCDPSNPISTIGNPCTSGAGACERSGVMVCSADGTVVCDAVPDEECPQPKPSSDKGGNPDPCQE